ncbi:hypothetical protein ECE50_028055 [Chitinophaga sp. Mgbs1]|uniref:HPt domain-containing protein n=1 Tax=Chitinophaga solisilvae TaxID=1233460 RepID=A0A9Q5GV45_9BACT|nr:hypothetical protein [Chitinophaga solisilvae]
MAKQMIEITPSGDGHHHFPGDSRKLQVTALIILTLMNYTADKIRPKEAAREQLYSYQYLELVGAGDLSFVKMMTLLFIVSLLDFEQQAADIAQAGDLTSLKQLTHKTSSSFTSLGMDYLQPHFVKIEQAGSWDKATDKSLQKLLDTTKRVVPMLQHDMENEIFRDK